MIDEGAFRMFRCNRCLRRWAHTCWPTERFEVIARICPDCIGRHFPIWGAA